MQWRRRAPFHRRTTYGERIDRTDKVARKAKNFNSIVHESKISCAIFFLAKFLSYFMYK